LPQLTVVKLLLSIMLRAVLLTIFCAVSARAFLVDTLGSVLGIVLSGGHPPHTVGHLEDAKYLGRWFQMYASESVAVTFERNAYCVTADYGVNANGTISVLNSDRLESATGPLDVIHGYAVKSDTVGQLTVHLETVPVPAPYWVIKLGPPTFGPEGLYQYSVVTDNLKATLFVLARDVDAFRRDYQAEVLQFLTNEGFTNLLNKPIETVHNSDCVYSAVPQK